VPTTGHTVRTGLLLRRPESEWQPVELPDPSQTRAGGSDGGVAGSGPWAVLTNMAGPGHTDSGRPLPLPTVMWLVAAAMQSGELRSTPDARTEFRLRRWAAAREGGASWPPLDSCWLAHTSLQEVRGAQGATFRRKKVFPGLDRALSCAPARLCCKFTWDYRRRGTIIE
jgi:hypothetical protein